ncbi:protein SPA, chloroplastic [Tripterygium wilfordii]|uniref:protein SPA, chloroplastic n=1 Tax=Tripterygium wilfordii TaxID=458696 RepID=UPI0018F805B9|nr:protein SPA, chloroplastic [Tripterygium wilfordii]
MPKLFACSHNLCISSASPAHTQHSCSTTWKGVKQQKQRNMIPAASKSGGFSLNSILKRCEACGGKGAVECRGCKGTGRNKKNGNIFERWKCYDCQGFGLVSCPSCGKGGLTPEQRGER